MKAALKRYWESTGRTDLIVPGPFWNNGRNHSRYEYIRNHTAAPEEVDVIIEECRRVIHEPKSSPSDVIRHFMLFLVAAYGIRCKAIRHFRERDVNLQERTFLIYRTKGDKTRTIYMDVPLDDLWPRVLMSRYRLIEQICATHNERPELKETFEQLPWFFFTKKETNWKPVGRQLHRSSVNSTVRYLTRRIVGRHISPHSFRHGKVFSLLDQGWKIERVAAYMGHNSVQTTFQYVHLGPEQMRAEAERVSNCGQPASLQPLDSPTKSSAAASLKTLFDQGVLSKDEYLIKMESILGIG
jgi:site-specific recombinase XerD